MYQWFVVLHLAGLFLFAAAHGISMWTAFRLRAARDRTTIALLLGASERSLMLSDLGLVILGIGGLGAAAQVGWLTAPWVVASYVVLVLLSIGMAALGSSLYYPLRDAVLAGKGEPLSDDELFRRLVNRRPEALALVGIVGVLVLIWLMVLKPGM